MDFGQAEQLQRSIEANIDRQIDDAREAERIVEEQFVPLFEVFPPDLRLRIADRINDRYGAEARHRPEQQQMDPEPDRPRTRYWGASDERRFCYSVDVVMDDKGRRRYESFEAAPHGARSKIAMHARKKDAMLRAARLLVEHEAKIAPKHAKAAYKIAVAAAKNATKPEDMWPTFNDAVKVAKSKSA